MENSQTDRHTAHGPRPAPAPVRLPYGRTAARTRGPVSIRVLSARTVSAGAGAGAGAGTTNSPNARRERDFSSD